MYVLGPNKNFTKIKYMMVTFGEKKTNIIIDNFLRQFKIADQSDCVPHTGHILLITNYLYNISKECKKVNKVNKASTPSMPCFQELIFYNKNIHSSVRRSLW